MRVFVTGATGWIGSAVVPELLSAGHHVVALVRDPAAAAVLQARGVEVLPGHLDDLDALRRGAGDAEAVVHLANKHDWAHPEESNRAERTAVETLGGALIGSDRPFLLACGVAGLTRGRPATEADPSPAVGPDSPRGGAENLALDLVDRGVRTVAVRFAPTVHAAGDTGFVAALVAAARRRGVSGWVGDGASTWSAVHRSDAARLVRLGLDAPAGTRLHAVAEEGVPTREIAEAIGRSLGLPTVSVDPADAVGHFGFLGAFFTHDMSASSAATRELLGWTTTGPTLLADIGAGAYAGA